jgi:hypothetical protein
MTTKIIPAERVTTCDRCGLKCTPDNRREDAVLRIERAYLEGQSVVGGNNLSYDLCDRCLSRLLPVIEGFLRGAS